MNTKKIENLFSLKNKIILITGAAGLLGQHHAEAVLKYEGKVILIDINKKKLQSLQNKLEKKYPKKVFSFCLDITNEKKVSNNCKLLNKKFGRLDGLVNNAAANPTMNSIKESFALENFKLENWNNDISIGLTGAFICTKYYGHLISTSSKKGSIVNISSDLGLIAPDQRIYPNPFYH